MPRKSKEESIGKRISTRRIARGFSQAMVARRAGIHPSYLSRIETGRVHPTLRTATRVAEAMRMSLQDLVGPAPPQITNRPCPVSNNGECLMDQVSADGSDGRNPKPERYSRRQIRLTRKFLTLIREAESPLLSAMDTLLNGLSRSKGDGHRKR